jgi:aerobic-type carbon monoxide dehydrogenase small subunit (CoxS/CutS family)
MSHDDAQTTHPAPAGATRRNFIKGVIAGGVAVSSAAYVFRNSPLVSGQAARTGGVERLLTLTVNGQTRRVDVAPQETLATTLRYKLGLTGTKLGCDRAECGACTVLVDVVPRYSCSVLTHAVRTRKIQTIEGLAAADGTLHPMQTAFREQHGLQCGYCTPGMVMAAIGILDENPHPTEAEVREGLEGNLCRCTGYHNIVAAVLAAADAT